MNSSIPNEAEYNITYDPHAALEFFKLFGKSESVRGGEKVFTQGQRANRFLLQHDNMYLLVKGKVNIQIAAATIASVKPGEIFGELTPLILSMRTATAVADGPCRLMSLSEKQLRIGLKQKPEFALMLMSALVKYLRIALTEKKVFSSATESDIEIKKRKKNSVFNTKMLRELVKKRGTESIIYAPKQRIIFQEGGSGMFMYVILEGYVTASIADKVVERSGAGAVIGEIALIDQKRRVARVVAETNCSLLAFNRQTFLEMVKSEPMFGVSLLRALASRLYLCYTGSSYNPPSPSLFDGF